MIASTEDDTPFAARSSPRSHLVRSCAASKGKVRRRYALMIELGRALLVCSMYDRKLRLSADASASTAAGRDARVRSDD